MTEDKLAPIFEAISYSLGRSLHYGWFGNEVDTLMKDYWIVRFYSRIVKPFVAKSCYGPHLPNFERLSVGDVRSLTDHKQRKRGLIKRLLCDGFDIQGLIMERNAGHRNNLPDDIGFRGQFVGSLVCGLLREWVDDDIFVFFGDEEFFEGVRGIFLQKVSVYFIRGSRQNIDLPLFFKVFVEA